MSEQSFFQSALSNFTHEVASGGGIRHLTDLGYTVKQISEQLSFPTSEERIRRQVWERLLDTKVILAEKPGSSTKEKADYVREYDKYGKASFRRVAETTPEKTEIHWNVLEAHSRKKGEIRGLLEKKIAENGEIQSYAACEFGILLRQEPARFHEQLRALDSFQREYVEGLPWEPKWVYHRLNSRMLNILIQLHTEGLWRGDCYFLKTGEQVRLG